jgi:peptide-methionine (R)-S-oxide reductase
MSRRSWLISAAAVLGGGALAALGRAGSAAQTAAAQTAAGQKSGAELAIERFSPEGKSLGSVKVAKVVLPDAEWRKKLSRAAYEVTRHEDTERPFTGEYLNNHKSGIYTCICCDTALFDSATKFESGTGWPSFWAPISKANVAEITDRTFGMVRVAVACARCDAHLGHVFDDGPQPTGLRYCMNSVSLHFVPRTGNA